MTKDQKLFMERVRTTIQWRLDWEAGEMIEHDDLKGGRYTKTHLSFAGTVSQKDLNSICETVNLGFTRCHTSMHISNSMGEIIPAYSPVSPEGFGTKCKTGVNPDYVQSDGDKWIKALNEHKAQQRIDEAKEKTLVDMIVISMSTGMEGVNNGLKEKGINAKDVINIERERIDGMHYCVYFRR